MTRIAYPYLRLSPSAVDSTVWEVVTEGAPLTPLQRYIEDWDYLSNIRIYKEIKVNRSIAAMQLDIPEDELQLGVSFRIGTGPGNMPRSWTHTSIVVDKNRAGIYIIDKIIDGRNFSQRIKLETTLILISPSINSGTLSPKYSAAKLWEHEYDVLLEGSEPRFPMEAVSFRKKFAGTAVDCAPWYLHWSPGSIHRDFGGSVRLYVNSDKEEFLERLNNGDQVTMQALMAGIMNQMIVGLLQQNDIEEHLQTCEDGSIGGYVKHWLSIAFPGETISSVRSKLEIRPSDFYASILSAAEFGDALL